MSDITITINGQSLTCNESESILQVARRAGIEIPAICYLSGCSPTVACKLCMVDIDGKRNYACNAKVKDGMNILTHTPEIIKERNAIMQSYDVNHPLQCGVCDKSGECELQNYTLKMQVSTQNYHIKESDKPHKRWAKATYDPNLCIMCERCATTCKDNIGEAKLKAQKADLEPLDMTLWKDSMPKDALSVWARKQKALIDFVSDTPCFDCGECISVCPVGALSTDDFKYKANAWELQKIESTCIHCPMGCQIIYEVRHNDALGTPHIYRVKNDFYFNPICGAGRYAYDVSSSVKPTQNLEAAINAFKKATRINVGNQTTNEEALVLNHLAKILHIPLHNDDALLFQSFLRAFLASAQKNTLNHIHDLKQSQHLIFIGGAINYQTPSLRYMLNNKLKLSKGAQVLYMHPLNENLMPSLSKNLTHIAYHPHALCIAVGSLALAYLCKNPNEDADTQALKTLIAPILQSKITTQTPITKTIKKTITRTNEQGEDITEEITESISEMQEDIVYQALLDAAISMEQFHAISQMLDSKPVLVLGADVYTESHAQSLAHICGILERKNIIKVLLVPPFANALGIAMICDLSASPIHKDIESHSIKNIDSIESTESMSALHTSNTQDSINTHFTSSEGFSSREDFSIGFRDNGDFICESDFINCDNSVDSIESHAPSRKIPDFILPALNQIEGTYTNMDGRILPLKAALPFLGYDLSDIAKAFGMKGDYLIDYTRLICGYEFDDFRNAFGNDGTDMRGFALTHLPFTPLFTIDTQPLSLPQYAHKPNAYKLHSPSQFNAYTAKSAHLQNKMGIYVSADMFKELHIKEGEYITLQDSKDSSKSVCGAVYIDHYLNQSCFLVNPMLPNADRIFASSPWASLHIAQHSHISHKEEL